MEGWRGGGVKVLGGGGVRGGGVRGAGVEGVEGWRGGGVDRLGVEGWRGRSGRERSSYQHGVRGSCSGARVVSLMVLVMAQIKQDGESSAKKTATSNLMTNSRSSLLTDRYEEINKWVYHGPNSTWQAALQFGVKTPPINTRRTGMCP